jgi:hypothetical protein
MKKINKTLIFVLFLSNIAFFMTSCKNEVVKNENQSLDGIAPKEGGNAALINNPTSANGTVVDANNAPVIRFDENFFNFGKIKSGKIITHVFKFSNVGKAPLLITECVSSCGCTIPTFPKEPIPPGQSSQIEVRFDSKDKSGKIQKIVTVYSNTIPNESKIGVEGEVSK